MIIVKLIGGLGNQMFQYSVGRQLAEMHNTKLKLDVTGFEKYQLRSYNLGAFNVKEQFATRDEIRSFAGSAPRLVERLWRHVGRPRLFRKQPYIKEISLRFDPDILGLPDNVYLEGYWQSEKYFLGIADTIRQELTVKDPLRGKNLEIADLMRSYDSVSLHVRRGDYVADTTTNQHHGVCSLDYYARCAAAVSERIANPHFFIFTDDPVWVRENLKLPYPSTFVDHNGPSQAHEDIRLMSACQHHIIANSSFSWWGAWLNKSAGKRVFAPKQWFAAEDVQTKADDLVPGGWNRM